MKITHFTTVNSITCITVPVAYHEYRASLSSGDVEVLAYFIAVHTGLLRQSGQSLCLSTCV